MAEYPREEIEAAWAEYQRRGVGEHDWPGWADMFTDDARYEEHFLGVFEGKPAIEKFIVDVMKEYPAMTLWIEWSIIDGDRIGLLHLEQPARPRRHGEALRVPEHHLPAVRAATGSSRSRPTTTTRPTPSGSSPSGSPTAAAATRRRTARCAASTTGTPSRRRPRSRVKRSRPSSRSTGQRAALAVESGDWDQWADQFTDDAHYREHHYGYYRSQQEIRDWIKSVMQPFPTMEFPPSFALIDGNRVSTLIPNILPAPEGDDGYYGFDVNTILHYAGNGKWSFEEDVYNPREAEDVVATLDRGGGVLPGA